MKLRRRQVALIFFALLALGLGGWTWLIHYQAKRAVVNYKKQLVAAGEKLTIDELIPKRAPSEGNRADLVFKAASMIESSQSLLDTNPPLAMRMMAPGKAIVGWAQQDIRNEETTNTWAEFESAIKDIEHALVLLDQVVAWPKLDFKHDYHQGFTVPLTNLTALKTLSQRLSAATVFALRQGDTEGAARRVRTTLAFVKGTQDECLVISQLVRIAIAQIAAAATWEFLAATNVSDHQLATLQQDWIELRFHEPAANALRMERAVGLEILQRMHRSGADFRKTLDNLVWPSQLGEVTIDGSEGKTESRLKVVRRELRIKLKEMMWRWTWSHRDELRALKSFQVLLEAVQLIQTNAAHAIAIDHEESGFAELGIYEIDTDTDFPYDPADIDLRTKWTKSVITLSSLINRLGVAEAGRRMTVVAIALKRHQLRHGVYPADLVALVPELLVSVPHDPMDDKQLRYRLGTDGSYVLYSIGIDGQDDGGVPNPADGKSHSLLWSNGRDWVWPQRAVETEVLAYYEQLQKRALLSGSEAEQIRRRYGLQLNQTDVGTGTNSANE